MRIIVVLYFVFYELLYMIIIVCIIYNKWLEYGINYFDFCLELVFGYNYFIFYFLKLICGFRGIRSDRKMGLENVLGDML